MTSCHRVVASSNSNNSILHTHSEELSYGDFAYDYNYEDFETSHTRMDDVDDSRYEDDDDNSNPLFDRSADETFNRRFNQSSDYASSSSEDDTGSGSDDSDEDQSEFMDYRNTSYDSRFTTFSSQLSMQEDSRMTSFAASSVQENQPKSTMRVKSVEHLDVPSKQQQPQQQDRRGWGSPLMGHLEREPPVSHHGF